PAIRITGNAKVNLVISGENELSVSVSHVGAGIQVDEGSTLCIYGEEGGSLTVTGGEYSAGIGGAGFKDALESNPSAGNIEIYSGSITAIGGRRGAGIGSGHHQSGGNISIYGGNITAYGTEGGAGIGAGYGTSGGGKVAVQVGYYNGGEITISGGTVFAASCEVDKNEIDLDDPAKIYHGYNSDVSNTFAAGIGGGYGASSGVIVIGGDAEVTAIGSCGGAGIGTGRGTSSSNKYNSDKAQCDITIKDNAKVVAITGKESRGSTIGEAGGAAIGLGRCWGIENTSVGTITIADNADVFAYADGSSNAIGTSNVVGKFQKSDEGIKYPADAKLKSITFGDNCKVIAMNAGSEHARSAVFEDYASGSVELCFFDDYFENTAEIFDDYPVAIAAENSDKEVYQKVFSLKKDDSKRFTNVTVHLPGFTGEDLDFVLDGVETDNGGRFLLHSSDDMWIFPNGSRDITNLLEDTYLITYHTNGGTIPALTEDGVAGNTDTYNIVTEDEVDLPDAECDGYNLDGWYDNEELTGDKITSFETSDRCDKEFWAKWVKKPEPEVEMPTAVAGLSEDGKPQELVTPGSATGGTIYYAVTSSDVNTAPIFDGASDSDDKIWNTDVPTADKEGTYKVWIVVVGDDTHNDTEPVSVTVEVKAKQDDGDKIVDDKVVKKYSIVAGSDTKWTKGSTKPFTFRIKGNVDDEDTCDNCTGVKGDGKDIASSLYKKYKGSVIIEVDPAYLETLEVGEHVLSVSFSDADPVDVRFTVVDADDTAVVDDKTDDAKTDSSKDAKVDVDDKSGTTNDASTDKATESKTDKVANTGDNAQPLLALFVMIDAALALNYVLLRKRRDKRN
nr:InlB B-repeat-containing protein [Eubacterium sp.]